MTSLHISKLRSGEGSEDELKVEEKTPLPRWGQEAHLDVVGRRVPRVEGEAKVTGRARYAYDVRLPGQLYAAVLRSPHPHARIRRIDTSRAERLPGVHAVVSSTNAAEVEWYEDSRLFDTTLRFAGEEVAAVAAESPAIAGDALRLIEVQYEVLPFVVSLEAALRPDAPRLREEGNLAGEPTVYERGDVEGALREAEVTVDEVYSTQTAL